MVVLLTIFTSSGIYYLTINVLRAWISNWMNTFSVHTESPKKPPSRWKLLWACLFFFLFLFLSFSRQGFSVEPCDSGTLDTRLASNSKDLPGSASWVPGLQVCATTAKNCIAQAGLGLVIFLPPPPSANPAGVHHYIQPSDQFLSPVLSLLFIHSIWFIS